jgi:hypothetical protein
MLVPLPPVFAAGRSTIVFVLTGRAAWWMAVVKARHV